MRGKLRDKRSDTKRDSFKREMERRRVGKRDNRTMTLVRLSQQVEQEAYSSNEEEDLLVETLK